MDATRASLHKLPGNVWPMHYKMCIKPDFKNWHRFEGHMEIKVKLTEPMNEILMHACKLNMKEVEFKMENGKTCKPEKMLHDEENEIVKFFFGGRKDCLSAGMGILDIKYEGELSDCELKGMYLNEWNKEERDMKEKTWIMTKLDGCQARMVIPCWDEPEFKATWKLEVELPHDWECLFNSEKEREEKMGDGKKKIHFKETPMMCASSLAWTMGKFEVAFEKMMDHNVKLRICKPKCRDGAKRKDDWAKWTFEMTCKMWECFTRKFGTDKARYPMEKIDCLVVPNYAVHGTGHLGLIQIWEDCFWVHEDMTGNMKKQRVTLEMAKHMAKQWIGNMVNLKDRKEMWLEESLAKFLKYHMVDKMCPEWSIWEHFTCEEMIPAMKFDMLHTTDPLEMSQEMMKAWMGKSSLECLEHMKAGDYEFLEKCCRFSKGAVILRMLKEWVGEPTFEKCLVAFFKKHCFGVAHSDDLWEELEMECKKPIKAIMKTWCEKKGYPVLHVNGKVDPGTGNFIITMKQEPVMNYFEKVHSFGKLESAHQFGDCEEPKYWIIPMCITTDPKGMQAKMDVLMDKEMMSIVIPAAEYRNSAGYFKIDPKHFCCMTVCYPEEMMRKMIMPMMQRREMMHHMDRFGFLFDVKKCTKMGLYRCGLLLDMMKVMAECGEDSLAVWRMMKETMVEMRNLAWDVDFFQKKGEMIPKMNKFVCHMIREKKSMLRDDAFWARTKMNKMKPNEEMLTALIAYLHVLFRDEEIEKKAVDTFWSWFRHGLNGDKWIMGDLQKTMFTAAAQTNDMKVADAFKKIYREYKWEDARELVVHGVGFFTEKNCIDKMIDWILSEEVAKEDKLRMFKSMGRRFPMAREAVWKMLKEKNDFFLKNYDHCRFGTNFIEEFLTNFVDEKEALEIAKWTREKIEKKHCTRMLQQSLEFVQMKANWCKRDCEEMKKCFEKF